MTTRRFAKYVHPMEEFVVWGGAFDDSEIERIKKTGELAEFEKGSVGSGGRGVVNPNIRETDITWIQPLVNERDNRWIFDKMHELVQLINHEKFQLDLTTFDGFQYSKYKEGSHYTWHTDTQQTPRDGLFRKLSVVTMLSDPDDYEGGDLLLIPNGNIDKPLRIRLNKGETILFYSWTPHKVEEVTKGKRITLVTWLLGNKVI